METIIFSQKKELSNLHLAPFSLAPKQTSCRMETVKHTLPVPLTIPQNTLSSPRRPSQNGELQPKKICLDWITAIALVKFDIDKGNVIDSIYPSNIFSKSEQKTISLLSFPDSNSFAGEGHLKFVFRLNRDHNCDFRSLFGYVYFNQQRDPANPRGFSQNSLVIFSVLPFSGFFKNAISILGARYFGQKNAYESEQYLKENFEIMTSEWPKPEPGIHYELSLHGYNLALNMPKNIYESKHIHMKSNTKDVRLSQEQRSFESAESPAKEVLSDEDEVKEAVVIPVSEEREQSLSTILSGFNLHEKGCFQDINLYKIFKGNKLSSLWKAWECILTNQPLMVMADLPSQCSEAVLGLLSTIYPLEYQTDYKPYFTIYDPDYREIQDLHDKKVAKCAVMGVTNPLFLKVLQNYPNILHLEEDYLKNKKSSSKKSTMLESTQKLYTQPDPMIKKMLIPSDSDEADAINDSLLRKSLQNLTENFLSAFHVYLRLQINDIKKFDEKEFMKFLEIQKFPFKGQFSSQKHILKLYAKFIKSANFQKFIKNFPNVYIVKKAEKS